jgi:hypothetical protein
VFIEHLASGIFLRASPAMKAAIHVARSMGGCYSGRYSEARIPREAFPVNYGG